MPTVRRTPGSTIDVKVVARLPEIAPRRPKGAVVAAPTAPAPDRDSGRARLGRLVAEIRAMKDQMSKMVHRTGMLLAELQKPEMIAAGGCKTFDELADKFSLPSRITAMKYVAVATSFSEHEAVELGVDKGYALVRYAAAVPRFGPPRQLLAANPRIAGVGIREISSKALLDALRATRAKQREAADAGDDTAQEADRAIRRLRTKLAREIAPSASFRRKRRGSTHRVLVELDADEALALAERL
jgi:hypothetical protein